MADLDDDLTAAWSKLEAYTARFALIFQLCSWAAGDTDNGAVDQSSLASAIALSDWFGSEARRVYASMSETEEGRDRREIIELIEEQGGAITCRDLMRASRKYPLAEIAETALAELVNAGLGRWRVSATATNQRREFVLTALTLTHSTETPETSECVNG